MAQKGTLSKGAVSRYKFVSTGKMRVLHRERPEEINTDPATFVTSTPFLIDHRKGGLRDFINYGRRPSSRSKDPYGDNCVQYGGREDSRVIRHEGGRLAGYVVHPTSRTPCAFD